MPVRKVLALDPWLEPLPTPGPVPVLPSESPPNHSSTDALRSRSDSVRPSLEGTTVTESIENSIPEAHLPLERILVINSEAFSLWKDHFTRLTEAVHAWEPKGRRLLTLSVYMFEPLSLRRLIEV